LVTATLDREPQFQQQKAELLFCYSACGKDAACNCGVIVIAKSERAAAAIRANSGRSNYQIADAAGVSEWTVRDARKEAEFNCEAPRS
jgi:hypothetical protein